MKKLIVVAFLILAGTVSTQAQIVRFGVKAGANFANYNGGVDGIDYKSLTSYHAGLVAEINVVQNFSVQPELLYSTQGATYKFADAREDFKNETAYISIPVMAKFYVLTDRLSLDVGPQFSFLVSEKNNVNLKDNQSFDFAAAGGVTLKVTESLFAQARYTIGLTEANKDAEVKNAVFQVSLGYLF